MSTNEGDKKKKSLNFIEQRINHDNSTGRYDNKVHTRFPPEPNGYLHIGHAKSICLNFGVAKDYQGKTNLRFDDTNPLKESTEYVDAIRADVKWLGFDWEDREFYASDYFDQLYDYAVQLIKKGKAYVDDQSVEEIAETRGTPTVPGKESPYRNRSLEENLALFEGMKNGDFKDGEKILRAKIDMSSPNMHMRDPALYRIRKVHHHRTGDTWSIYPMYDFAHCLSDSIEGITHSLCTLEFEVHRPLYDWILEELEVFHPQQIEFARLNLNYTVMSKRKLLELVEGDYVSGWDDPRMPTISGMRRRGYTPEAIRNFCETIGVAKRDGIIDIALLEHSVREDLNKKANRVMGVLNPVKVIITNYPEGETEELPAINNPEDDSAGKRLLPFGREIYIDREDFMEDPPRKFFRLGPGRDVRLKYAYIITCDDYKKNEETGEIEEIYCTYHVNSKSGQDTSGLKPKGTLGWVHAPSALDITVNQYDRLFKVEAPANDKEKDFKEFLNPDSLNTIKGAKIEPSVKDLKPGTTVQFERLGYFCVDPDSSEGNLIFNRTVTLKDSWSKEKNK
ncbi:glutamine--tRNA ligase/YqeY domain fusion protein [Marinigracilibium pacificum]|uniref:Glutamine--tRNA ligase n=1 Tax=Marinigracilibium pacificum TaxID=2729599 RepID=A0A848IY04_9BACT|nr:glutamine--tRNA ligase/YqeY domain fusion protein [Marinigracilibium pacificum]NMM48165.1 glutamine--tRNA ligase/YqeY domain fusion protein [Marinigracilibium pacificum]